MTTAVALVAPDGVYGSTCIVRQIIQTKGISGGDAGAHRRRLICGDGMVHDALWRRRGTRWRRRGTRRRGTRSSALHALCRRSLQAVCRMPRCFLWAQGCSSAYVSDHIVAPQRISVPTIPSLSQAGGPFLICRHGLWTSPHQAPRRDSLPCGAESVREPISSRVERRSRTVAMVFILGNYHLSAA